MKYHHHRYFSLYSLRSAYSAASSSSSVSGISCLTSISPTPLTPVLPVIRFQRITFSLHPLRKSWLAPIAAVLSTFVVSWNDAAEIQDEVPRDDLVIPSRIGVEVAGRASLYSTGLLSFRFRIEFSSLICRKVTVCPAFSLLESPGSVIIFLSKISSFSLKKDSLSTGSPSRN